MVPGEGWYQLTKITHRDCDGGGGSAIHVVNDAEGPGKVIDEFRVYYASSVVYDVTPEKMYVSKWLKITSMCHVIVHYQIACLD